MSAQYIVKLEEKKTIISIYQKGEQIPVMEINKKIFFDLIKDKKINCDLITATEARNNIIANYLKNKNDLTNEMLFNCAVYYYHAHKLYGYRIPFNNENDNEKPLTE